MSVLHTTYTRPDGVVGVGFQIEHGGRLQHSVAWPDRRGERFTDAELERLQITRDETAADDRETAAAALPALPAAEPMTSQAEPDNTAQATGPLENQEIAQLDSEPDRTGQADSQPEAEPLSEAEAIRQKLAENPKASNKEIIETLAAEGIEVASSQISRQKKNLGL